MFQNPRPAEKFRETVGWNSPASQSSFGLKTPPGRANSPHSINSRHPVSRPGLSISHSAGSSSLDGLEQTVPSFQTFLSLTPSVDSRSNKPLPPTPLSSEPSEDSLADWSDRRQSSVYSRNPSNAASDDRQPKFEIELPERDASSQQSPWKIQLPESDPSPRLPSCTYQTHVPTSMLRKEDEYGPVGLLLEPRTFSPLIATPSSTMSVMTADPPLEGNAQASPHPSSDLSMFRPKAPTMSLEQAKQAMNAPGAVHMLPEELRALRKGMSQGRLQTMDLFGAGQKAPLLSKPTDLRNVRTQEKTPSSKNQPDLKSPAQNAFAVGTGPVRETLPSTPEPAARRDNTSDEIRGRTMQRTSKRLPGHGNDSHIAKQYISVLNQQSRSPPTSPSYDSDDSIKAHMKMVPRPLFQGKQRTHSKRSNDSRQSSLSISSFNMHRQGRNLSSRSSGTGFNLRLSSADVSRSRVRTSENSSIGVIPISPPIYHGRKRGESPHIDSSPSSGGLRSKSHKRDESLSHYYPHLMHRKSAKRGRNKNGSPSKLSLAPSVITSELKTSNVPPETSTLDNSPQTVTATMRKPSDTGSERSTRRLYQRLAKGVRGRRRSSQGESSTERDPSPRAPDKPSPSSPHLVPAPIKTAAVYLGWSAASKRIFDEATSPTSSRPRLPSLARPPETSDFIEPTGPGNPSVLRRPHLIHHVFDGWKEKKARRKRADLKRTIRVVTPVGATAEAPPSPSPSRPGLRRGSLFGAPALPVILPRRQSTYGWL